MIGKRGKLLVVLYVVFLAVLFLMCSTDLIIREPEKEIYRGYAFDFLCDSVFCSLLWNMPSVWCDSGSMDLSAYYLRIFSGRMEKRFIAGCDLSYILLCVSAFHQAD